MSTRFVCVIILLMLVIFEYGHNLQVIPERTAVSFFSTKYFEYVKFSIKRYGRKSAYYMNADVMVYYRLDNNMTLHAYFNEYLHNEFRRSFVEFHFKFCDLLNKDPYIGGTLLRGGIRCPVLAGRLLLPNMTVPTENFPNVFPFEKGRIDFNFTSTATGELLLCASLVATFKK